jgi:hypothetical protein
MAVGKVINNAIAAYSSVLGSDSASFACFMSKSVQSRVALSRINRSIAIFRSRSARNQALEASFGMKIINTIPHATMRPPQMNVSIAKLACRFRTS